jgi:hypothetical protein
MVHIQFASEADSRAVKTYSGAAKGHSGSGGGSFWSQGGSWTVCALLPQSTQSAGPVRFLYFAQQVMPAG